MQGAANLQDRWKLWRRKDAEFRRNDHNTVRKLLTAETFWATIESSDNDRSQKKKNL